MQLIYLWHNANTSKSNSGILTVVATFQMQNPQELRLQRTANTTAGAEP